MAIAANSGNKAGAMVAINEMLSPEMQASRYQELKVIPVLDEFSKYSYHARDLAKELKPVYKKVEMFDFMSAYEAVAKIKEKA